MKRRRSRLLCWENWLLAVMTGALFGCTTIPSVPAQHIVMVNGRGNPVDPTGNLDCGPTPNRCEGQHLSILPYHEIDRAYYREVYLQDLFDSLKRHPTKDGKRRILIFVHGGLNTQVDTVKRAAKLRGSITEAGFFPIFVNWQSSLISSYVDHLFNIRQGKSWDVAGWWMAPFYLGADLARAVVRAPVVWWFQAWNDVKSWPVVTQTDEVDARRVAGDLKAKYEPYRNVPDDHRNGKSTHSEVIAIADGEDERGPLEMAISSASWVITVPTKLLTAPVIDAFGKSAWDIMVRRTHLLYHTEGEFRTDSDVAKEARRGEGLSRIKPDGALSVFLRGLEALINDPQHSGREAWDITLVGHSMGTIVLNEMIRSSGNLPISTIVYMAAACTIRDYEDSVFPYLRKNKNAQFFHFVLHERAEARDRWEPIRYLDPPPRGSLLVWIDDFLSHPETPLDRTLGRFSNLMVAVHDTPEEIRGQIHIREFSVGAKVDDTNPQKHGHFAQYFRFWVPACWNLNASNSGACYYFHDE